MIKFGLESDFEYYITFGHKLRAYDKDNVCGFDLFEERGKETEIIDLIWYFVLAKVCITYQI